jgi:hypothetical protein
MPTGPETILLVVELLATFGEPDRQQLLDACSRAFDGGLCVEQNPSNGEEPFSARVESTSSEHVLIEVTLQREGQQLYSSREISFQPEDVQAERTRSLGLSLGVLANTLLSEQETPTHQEGLGTTESLPATDVEANPDRTQRTGKDPTGRGTAIKESPLPVESDPAKSQQGFSSNDLGSVLLGLSLGVDLHPTWRSIGPSADLSIGFFTLSSLVLQGRFAAAYQLGREDRPALLHLSPSVGAGWYFDFQSLGLLPLVEGGVEHITASIQDTDTADAVSQLSHWSGFVRASSAFLIPIGRGFYFSATPALVLSFSPTEPSVDGISQGSSGLLRFSARGGFSWIH